MTKFPKLQGLKGLIDSGEVVDVLSASFKGEEDKNKKKKKGKRAKVLENLGGWGLFQFTANLQRGVGQKGKDVFRSAPEV